MARPRLMGPASNTHHTRGGCHGCVPFAALHGSPAGHAGSWQLARARYRTASSRVFVSTSDERTKQSSPLLARREMCRLVTARTTNRQTDGARQGPVVRRPSADQGDGRASGAPWHFLATRATQPRQPREELSHVAGSPPGAPPHLGRPVALDLKILRNTELLEGSWVGLGWGGLGLGLLVPSQSSPS